jgi:hypothetical protein
VYYLKTLGLILVSFCLAVLATWGTWLLATNGFAWDICGTLIILILLLAIDVTLWSMFGTAVMNPHSIIGCKYPKVFKRLNPCQEYLECDICHQKKIFGEHRMETHKKEMAGNVCKAVDVCLVCGLEVPSTNHTFPPRPDECYVTQVCTKCGHAELVDNHDYVYEATGSTNGNSYCRRCEEAPGLC